RMGGDEFVIILPGVSEDTVDTIVKRFCAVTQEIGWSVCGKDVLALSVGRAVLPKDGSEAEVLLAEADLRMYKSKRNGKLARAATDSTLSLSNALGTNSISAVEIQAENSCELPSRPDILLRLGWQPVRAPAHDRGSVVTRPRE